jgi:lipopolysaccharide export LptBFGC system permease protein LptF
VPCSIKHSRRESSKGLALTLSVVVLFYLASIFCESLGRYPMFHAHYLALIPVLLSLFSGIVLAAKTE